MEYLDFVVEEERGTRVKIMDEQRLVKCAIDNMMICSSTRKKNMVHRNEEASDDRLGWGRRRKTSMTTKTKAMA